MFGRVVLKQWGIDLLFGRISAFGLIFNDNRFADGTTVHTSRIINIDKRQIITKTGSKYTLIGDPIDWFEEILTMYRYIDWNCPIDCFKKHIIKNN